MYKRDGTTIRMLWIHCFCAVMVDMTKLKSKAFWILNVPYICGTCWRQVSPELDPQMFVMQKDLEDSP